MRLRHDQHKDNNQSRTAIPPVVPRACVKYLELRLGDVVSRNLQCLVNKLCETATTAITLSSDPASREISSNLPGTAGWQLFGILRSLADGNIQFAVRYFMIPKLNSQPGITDRSKTIEGYLRHFKSLATLKRRRQGAFP